MLTPILQIYNSPIYIHDFAKLRIDDVFSGIHIPFISAAQELLSLRRHTHILFLQVLVST